MNDVLFVCTGNTCRSPMAEGIFNFLLADRGVKASSGGMAVISPSHPSFNAICAAKKYGSDISEHKAYQIKEEDLQNTKLVLTMTNAHKMMLKMNFPIYAKKIYTIYEYALGNKLKDVSDPYGGSAEVYQKCCDEIYFLVQKIAEKWKVD